MKKNISWLMLAITLAVAALRAQPPQTQPIPENILVVRSDSLQGLVGARALFPLRGGLKGEAWAIADVLATGSRSPTGEHAPRIQIAQTDPTLKKKLADSCTELAGGRAFRDGLPDTDHGTSDLALHPVHTGINCCDRYRRHRGRKGFQRRSFGSSRAGKFDST